MRSCAVRHCVSFETSCVSMCNSQLVPPHASVLLHGGGLASLRAEATDLCRPARFDGITHEKQPSNRHNYLPETAPQGHAIAWHQSVRCFVHSWRMQLIMGMLELCTAAAWQFCVMSDIHGPGSMMYIELILIASFASGNCQANIQSLEHSTMLMIMAQTDMWQYPYSD